MAKINYSKMSTKALEMLMWGFEGEINNGNGLSKEDERSWLLVLLELNNRRED